MEIKVERKMRKIMFQHKFWLCLAFIAAVIGAVSELLKAYLMQNILDVATAGSREGFRKVLIFTAVFLVFTLLVLVFKSFAREKFVKECVLTLKRQWFSDVQKKQLCNYDVQKSAAYISHFTVDTITIEDDYLRRFLQVMDYVVTGLASVIAIFRVHYAFIVFVAITFWIPLLINHLWEDKLTAIKLRVSKVNGVFVESLKEILAGFEVSKLFGLSARMQSVFQKRNTEAGQERLKSELIGDMASACSNTASVGIWMGNLLLGAYFTVRGVMTVGMILNVNQLLNHVVNPLYGISYCVTRMKAADKLYQSVSADLAQGIEDEEGIQKVAEFKHDIALEDICLNQKERIILEHVNLEFQKDKKYLLVGESGSGKSSLMKILLNIYAGYTGKVMIDGLDFKKIDKDSWYKNLSVVSQDGFVFHDTLYNNLTLYQSYSDTEVQKVMELCGLSEFVKMHEEGLEFVIEENGKNISGGERQRICLARALIRKPSILILDEATSALNQEMAQQIERNILNLEGITVISISHRVFPELKELYHSTLTVANHAITRQ